MRALLRDDSSATAAHTDTYFRSCSVHPAAINPTCPCSSRCSLLWSAALSHLHTPRGAGAQGRSCLLGTPMSPCLHLSTFEPELTCHQVRSRGQEMFEQLCCHPCKGLRCHHGSTSSEQAEQPTKQTQKHRVPTARLQRNPTASQ